MATIVDALPAGPAEPAWVAAFEAEIGHQLPAEYRDFLLRHNGGRPVPDTYDIERDGETEESIVMCFFPLREPDLADVEPETLEELATWPLRCAWEDLSGDLDDEAEEALLPVGTDGSGNYVCLVLARERSGAVVFFDHETGEAIFLADGFTAFLGSLRE